MYNFRRRKSFPNLDMDDMRPLMLDPAEGEPDQHAVECSPEDLLLAHESEAERRAQQQERKTFRNILTLGLSFMLLFTSFNTNGIMTVSTFISHRCMRVWQCVSACIGCAYCLYSGLAVRHLLLCR